MKRILMSFIICMVILALCAGPVTAESTKICRSVPNDAKRIALTFDDGPHPTYTREILNILDSEGIKATFFMLGSNAESYPELVSEVHSRGHEIGNHTYSHKFLTTISDEKITDELTRTERIITEITGEKPVIFRPPGGSYSSRSISTVKALGYTPILWSQDSRDWQMPSSESIIKKMTASVQSGDILLFHDFNRKPSPTPAAVKEIITQLQSEGYRFVTVSELIAS